MNNMDLAGPIININLLHGPMLSLTTSLQKFNMSNEDMKDNYIVWSERAFHLSLHYPPPPHLIVCAILYSMACGQIV